MSTPNQPSQHYPEATETIIDSVPSNLISLNDPKIYFIKDLLSYEEKIVRVFEYSLMPPVPIYLMAQ